MKHDLPALPGHFKDRKAPLFMKRRADEATKASDQIIHAQAQERARVKRSRAYVPPQPVELAWKPKVPLCNICKRMLNNPKDPTTEDCGGDCLKCMAEIGLDPDCIKAMEALVQAR